MKEFYEAEEFRLKTGEKFGHHLSANKKLTFWYHSIDSHKETIINNDKNVVYL